MKILLSGGTGLIGRVVGSQLALKGHEIVVLTRDARKSKDIVSYPHQAVEWDGESQALEASCFEGVDAVVHLAGVSIAEKRWSSSFKLRLENSRIQATQNLLKNVSRTVKIFIGASAIGYYPETFDSPSCEGDPPGDHFFGQLCERWEKKAYEYLDSNQTRVVHVRTGLVLSPQGGALEKMIPPLKTGLAGPLGSGNQIMSWIDIEDVVGIFCHCLDQSSIQGPINAVAPLPVTNKEFTRTIGRRICRPVILNAPKIVLYFVVGEFAQYLLMSQNISGKKIQDLGYTFKYGDLKKSIEKNISIK